MKSGSSRVTHQQFFAICEELRNRREEIEKGLKKTDIQKLLQDKLGYSISTCTVRDALQTVGIQVKKQAFSEDKRIKTANTFAKALIQLYTKLGEPVPADLQELYNRLVNNIGISTAKPLGIPVSKVLPSSSIPVVKLKS